MKIRVTLKDPDTMPDSVEEAVKKLPKPADLTFGEWKTIREGRVSELTSAISDEWMQYGEYLTVEFDTDAKTATVIRNSDGA